MDILFTLAAFLFLVGLVITIHEGGHFLLAKLCGMKVLEFSIGFGPVIYQRRIGKDQFKFTLRLLPLGGFVKPLDEGSVSKEEWEALPEEEKARSFNRSNRIKKFLMVAGGPLSNFVLAFVVFVIAMSFVGIKSSPPIISEVAENGILAQSGIKEGDKVTSINGREVNLISEAFSSLVNHMIKGDKVAFTTDKGSYEVDYSKQDLSDFTNNDIGKMLGFYFAGTVGDVNIKEVDSKGSGYSAGLKVGDIIKKVNGETVYDINKTIRKIQLSPEKPITLTLERDNKLIDLVVVPEPKKEGKKIIGKVGATFDITGKTNEVVVRYGLGDSIEKSFYKVGDSSYTTLVSIGKLVTGQLSAKTISGPIAIADYSGKSAKKGLYYYLNMIASLSIAIGVFNLLPIPLLDGGHLLQYMIEGTMRKELPVSITRGFQYLGIVVLVSVFSFSLLNDIIKYVF